MWAAFLFAAHVETDLTQPTMNKALLSLVVSASVISSHSQGTIEFGTFKSEIRFSNGIGLGVGYTAGLFLAAGLTQTTTPLGITDFIPGTGFLNPINVTVPGVPGRTLGTFVIRVWDTASGSFANARITRGESAPFTVASLGGAGEPPDLPASLDGSTYAGFTILPEPSTYALGIAGLGALAIMRRRK